jgi:zinc finger protein 423
LRFSDGEGLAEGQTLQMITGENGNQMILVQGEGQEPQLIDASCLNAEGTHITTEDGTQIPVSMSYGQQPGDSGSLTILNEDGTQGQIQFQIQSQDENGQTTAILADGQQILLQTSDLQHHMHDDGSMHQQMMEHDEEEQQQQQQIEGEEVEEHGQQHEEQMEEAGELESQITIDEQQEAGVKQENNDELFDFEDLIQGNSITKAASAGKKK